MKIKIRKHQENCIHDCLDWIKKSVEPAVVEATVSFGKSITIGKLAQVIVEISKKKVLILCPTGNLVKQNSGKVRELGYKCSVFSASLNQKSTTHDIIVGTPQSIANALSKFGPQFAAILIDEGDGLTNAVRDICINIKSHNPNVRIVGFTGTPWTTRNGYVYRIDVDGKTLGEDVARNPFYLKCVHKTRTPDLLKEGYLTPIKLGSVLVEKYQTRGMVANAMGVFRKEDVDRAYHGHGRKSSMIVRDIVAQSEGKEGVLIFGATIQHCKEIMASLPPELSRMVASSEKENQKNIDDFKAKKYKYLVNKDMVTVGADFPHVDVIAVLRKSSSARLLAQILGRGARLHDDNWIEEPPTSELRKLAIENGPKPFCLYLDYTEDNVSEHFPDGDIYNPVIKATGPKEAGKGIKAICPSCSYENRFSCRPEYEDNPVDENGYCIDVFGSRIETDYGPMPAHFGRRCFGFTPSITERGKLDRCDYYWSSKLCEACEEKNDISARYCRSCKAELVDPGEKLIGEFKAHKRDPHLPQCDAVLSMTCKQSVSQAGNPTLRVDWVTPYRQFSTYLLPESDRPMHKRAYEAFISSTDNGNVPPKTISYRKSDSKFFTVYDYNQPEDEEPVMGAERKVA